MKNTARRWFEIKNADADTAEVYIYDQIGADWFGSGVTAKDFAAEFKAITAGNISLRINSPGGSVFEGVAIATAIKSHTSTVTAHIDGLAASIASIIALAADRVVMSQGAFFMIHNPWGGAWGTAEDMRKYADTLDKIRDQLAAEYVDKSGLSLEEVLTAMDAETWYSANEAKDAGFVDEIEHQHATASASTSFDLTQFGYRNAPQRAQSEQAVEPAAPAVTEEPESAGAAAAEISSGAPENNQSSQTFIDGLGFVTIPSA